MAKPICCQEVGEHLARHGMPSWRVERITDELAEHWEDLHRTALDRGFTRHEAVVEANRRLGRPAQLARATIFGLRRNCWMGRHPILAICILPVILPALVISIVATPYIVLDHWLHFSSLLIKSQQLTADVLVGAARVTYFLAAIGSVSWLCRRAWTNGLGLRWVLALCSWFTLASLLRFVDADPVARHVTVGVAFPARLNTEVMILFAVHLLVAGGFYLMARGLRKKSTEQLLQACFS